MSSRGSYRRELCSNICSGALGHRDAQREYALSANLIQKQLTQFDRGQLSTEEVEADVITECEARVAALERKMGQLTMALELVKKLLACAS